LSQAHGDFIYPHASFDLKSARFAKESQLETVRISSTAEGVWFDWRRAA
jgi:hypothetical protein